MKCLTQWMLKGELITAYPSVNSIICSLLNVSFTLKCWRHHCQALMAGHWQHELQNTLSGRMWRTLWQLSSPCCCISLKLFCILNPLNGLSRHHQVLVSFCRCADGQQMHVMCLMQWCSSLFSPKQLLLWASLQNDQKLCIIWPLD